MNIYRHRHINRYKHAYTETERDKWKKTYMNRDRHRQIEDRVVMSGEKKQTTLV